MDERNENPASGSADFLSAEQIRDMVERTSPKQVEGAPTGTEPVADVPGPEENRHVEAAREHLADVIHGSETDVPQSPDVITTQSRRERGLGGPVGASNVALTPETELEMMATVDKKSRRTRAKEALIRAAKRMEESALNVAASLVVRGIKHERARDQKASDDRLKHVDKKLSKSPAEYLEWEDEKFAPYYEASRAFLEPPSEKRSIDQSHRYHRWVERRRIDDPQVAAAVAAAEAPIQARMDEIMATGLFGNQFAFPQGPRNKLVTPPQYQDTHYEWKKGDPRYEQFPRVLENNIELRKLITEKLAARNAVLAQHSGQAEVQ